MPQIFLTNHQKPCIKQSYEHQDSRMTPYLEEVVSSMLGSPLPEVAKALPDTSRVSGNIDDELVNMHTLVFTIRMPTFGNVGIGGATIGGGS